MEEPKDKRTKAWKQWKQEFDEKNSIGLGDVVEKITEATGIKAIVNAVTDDCGCEEKKVKLNKKYRFSYSRNNLRCFNEETYNKWTELKPRAHKTLSEDDYKTIVDIGIQLFEQDNTKQIHTCGPCLEYLIIDINRVYDNE